MSYVNDLLLSIALKLEIIVFLDMSSYFRVFHNFLVCHYFLRVFHVYFLAVYDFSMSYFAFLYNSLQICSLILSNALKSFSLDLSFSSTSPSNQFSVFPLTRLTLDLDINIGNDSNGGDGMSKTVHDDDADGDGGNSNDNGCIDENSVFDTKD